MCPDHVVVTGDHVHDERPGPTPPCGSSSSRISTASGRCPGTTDDRAALQTAFADRISDGGGARAAALFNHPPVDLGFALAGSRRYRGRCFASCSRRSPPSASSAAATSPSSRLGAPDVVTVPSTGLQFSSVSDVAQFVTAPPGYRIVELNDDRYSTSVVRFPRPATRRCSRDRPAPARRPRNGSRTGVGRATAVALAAMGMPVVASARSVDEVDGVVSEIAAAGGEAAALACDLTDRASRRPSSNGPHRSSGRSIRQQRGVGSSADPRPLAEFRDSFRDETLELNLTPYLPSKAARPHTRTQRWGRIVTVASIKRAHPVAEFERVRREQDTASSG